jgi:predicted nucleic acid-binding protein
MRYLVDTNVLLRWAQADTADHDVCTAAIVGLLRGGHHPCICAQVLIEFRCVATRPCDKNGLGISPSQVGILSSDARGSFTCLTEPSDIADRWEVLADRYAVMGKQCHDTRLVALMLAHGITHLLTLNASDFARYTEITPVTPQEMP